MSEIEEGSIASDLVSKTDIPNIKEEITVAEEPPKQETTEEVIKVNASAKAKKKPAPRVLRKDPDVDLHKTDVICPDCNKTLRRYCLERHKKSFCKVTKEQKKKEAIESSPPPLKLPAQAPTKTKQIIEHEAPPPPQETIQEMLKQMIKSKVDEKKTRYTNMMSKIYKL